MIRLAGLGLFLAAAAAGAHPLGNNTVNRQATLSVAPGRADLHYLLDLAEIPALAAAVEADGDGDGLTTASEWDLWAAARQEEIRRSLHLRLDRQDLVLRSAGREWRLAPGQAGLDTLRLRLEYGSEFADPEGELQLDYRDDYRADRAGWQEIRVVGQDGLAVAAADVPDIDRSKGLTEFPATAAPPRELAATARLKLAPAGTGEPEQSAVQQPAEASRDRPDGAPERTAATAGGRWHEAWQFYRLGLRHIAAGLDHLAFLLGLLLSARRLTELVQVVTAFTAAHSLTLALAANGWIAAPEELVEPSIAASIAYVGARSLTGSGAGHGLYLAFGFGLIHGLGFAGALAESLAAGTRGGRYWLSDLAAFNLGIESLQLVVAGLAFALLSRCRNRRWARPVTATASFTVMAAGLGWLVVRVGG